MRTTRVHLHSRHAHPAHGMTVTVDAHRDGVPVASVKVAMVDDQPVVVHGGPSAEQIERVGDQEWAVFERVARDPLDGVWLFEDSDMRLRPPPVVSLEDQPIRRRPPM